MTALVFTLVLSLWSMEHSIREFRFEQWGVPRGAELDSCLTVRVQRGEVRVTDFADFKTYHRWDIKRYGLLKHVDMNPAQTRIVACFQTEVVIFDLMGKELAKHRFQHAKPPRYVVEFSLDGQLTLYNGQGEWREVDVP